MTSRTLLIGQAPGPNTDPELPLFPVPATSAGGRLRTMTGLTRGEYMARFERVNLLYEFPGWHRRDDKFPVATARAAAMAMKPLLSGREVILVGRNVAKAFGIGTDFYVWSPWQVRRRCRISGDLGTAQVAVIPHPSGRNHWYNKVENRAKSLKFWQIFMSGK